MGAGCRSAAVRMARLRGLKGGSPLCQRVHARLWWGHAGEPGLPAEGEAQLIRVWRRRIATSERTGNLPSPIVCRNARATAGPLSVRIRGALAGLIPRLASAATWSSTSRVTSDRPLVRSLRRQQGRHHVGVECFTGLAATARPTDAAIRTRLLACPSSNTQLGPAISETPATPRSPNPATAHATTTATSPSQLGAGIGPLLGG